MRKFSGQSNFEDWAKTELTQNFKAIEDAFRGGKTEIFYSEGIVAKEEQSNSEKNIPEFSITVNTEKTDVLTIGVCPNPKIKEFGGIGGPRYTGNATLLYAYDNSTGYAYLGGFHVLRKKMNSSEDPYIVYNIQSSGNETFPLVNSFSFLDQPGEGTFKYYCSYETFGANTYLSISNMRMFVKRN